jgi:hypothetical protein
MGQTKIANKILENTSEGKIKFQRPKVRLLEDVENDLRELRVDGGMWRGNNKL